MFLPKTVLLKDVKGNGKYWELFEGIYLWFELWLFKGASLNTSNTTEYEE